MGAVETAAGLASFPQRGAGTESERLAAKWLAEQVRTSGSEPKLEPFWCRPNWALAQAWHVVLGLAGSLVSVSSPRLGGALILLALLSVIADELTGFSPGRRLTFEHASQNVIAHAPTESQATAQQTTRLIITANYDAGRLGLVYGERVRAVSARLRALTGDRAPGWLGWLAIALAWLLAVAIARLEGSKGTAIGALQLVPTAGLVLGLALLLELASSDYGPAAGDNGSGAAVALALLTALGAAPPRYASVELVLQGASDGSGLGLRRHLRKRPGSLKAENTIVLGIGPCGSGRVRWWTADGAFVPMRYNATLRDLCAGVASDVPELGARGHRGRGALPALAARAARLPSISIGCLDERGLVARSHQRSDTAQALDGRASDEAVQFGLMLVDAIDARLARSRGAGETERATI